MDYFTVYFGRRIRLTGLICAVMGMFVSGAAADLVVFDRVTTEKTPVRLAILTKGKFFAKGGRLVDIYLPNSKMKRIMTGGDGYGYFQYLPLKSGMERIEAHSNGDEATGLVLVMKKSEKAVIVEVEAGFKDAVFSDEFRTESRAAVEKISKKFKILYVSRYIGAGLTRKWLEQENFPESVILPWKGAGMLATLKEKGVNLHAIIASPSLAAAAAEHIENRYCFEETRDGTMVKNWQEILEQMTLKSGTEF